jgi:hypothetical protein
MRRPPVNTWDIVAPPGIHVITATLTTLQIVGIVTVAVAIVATVTRTATLMEETEIGAIVGAPLLPVVVDTPLTIGVAGATLAAHPLEEPALHLVAEGVVVVVAQETTRRPLQQALQQLQHLLLNTRGGDDFLLHPLRPNQVIVVPVACDLCVCLALFILSCPFFLLGPCRSLLLLI